MELKRNRELRTKLRWKKKGSLKTKGKQYKRAHSKVCVCVRVRACVCSGVYHFPYFYIHRILYSLIYVLTCMSFVHTYIRTYIRAYIHPQTYIPLLIIRTSPYSCVQKCTLNSYILNLGTPTVLSSSLHSTATPPLVGHKPPLGRPPKRPSSETPASQPTSPNGDIPVIKRLKQQPVTDATPTQLDTPKPSPKHQGLVRKRAAASARQRWKEICEAEDQSEDSLDSLNASWKSGSTDSASLLSLDIGFENAEGEARRGGKPWNSPERLSSNKGRVYNRYCSGPKDDVIHCLCGSFKEEGFMIQVRP